MLRLIGWLFGFAMFLVGGGILVHGIGPVHHWVESIAQAAQSMSALLGTLAELALNAVLGIVAGALVLLAVSALRHLLRQRRVLRT